MKTRITLTILVALVALLFAPTPVQAQCSGFLCNLFGSFERQEMRNAKEIELARIDQAKQAEVTRIQAEGAERLKQAEAQLAREVAAGQLSQEQARVQGEMFKVAVESATAQNIRSIELEYDAQAQLIMQQTQIALSAVAEAGQTERWRIGWDAGSSVVAVLVIGALIALFMHRQSRQPTIVQPWNGYVLPVNHPAIAQRPGDVYDIYEAPGMVEYPPVHRQGDR